MKELDFSDQIRYMECFACELSDLVKLGFTFCSCCADIENNNLVDFLLVEDSNGVDGITYVLVIFEFHRLNQFTFLEQQDRNDA